jgi:hypothetical protein
MLAFACPACHRLVTFESTFCLHCKTELLFDPVSKTMGALSEPEAWRCTNAGLCDCNWLAERAGDLCASCALTRTRPNDHDARGLNALALAESAKRRLLFELTDLGLPVEGAHEKQGGLAFDLLSSECEPVITGHSDGVITVDLHEADPAHREAMRVVLGEPYRTLLGHMRHEVAHYYQTVLVRPGTHEELLCREVFGDERCDYQQALDRYYALGAPADWQERFVSAYATMHPWEDWAETFAHYLHIRDTLQTAAAYGVHVEGPLIFTADAVPLHSEPIDEPEDIEVLLDTWIPLTYALNAINRSMGEADVYPFIISPEVKSKLEFIDRLTRGAAR